jgi:hypothetical protein
MKVLFYFRGMFKEFIVKDHIVNFLTQVLGNGGRSTWMIVYEPAEVKHFLLKNDELPPFGINSFQNILHCHLFIGFFCFSACHIF